MRTFALLAIAAAALLAFPALGHGKIVARKDTEGRPITFDVRAPNVPLAWYARHMRRALPGYESSTLLYHEYGHDVDISYGGVRGVPEMNGTAG